MHRPLSALVIGLTVLGSARQARAFAEEDDPPVHAQEEDAPVQAEESVAPPPPKVTASLSSGARFPVSHDGPIDQLMFVPIAAELGLSLKPWLRGALVLEYAPGVHTACSGSWCGGWLARGAIDLEARGSAVPAIPWFRLGIGLEHWSAKADGGDVLFEEEKGGAEAHVQAGFDFGKRTMVGPFVFASLNGYSEKDDDFGRPVAALHGWLGLGLRMTQAISKRPVQ